MKAFFLLLISSILLVNQSCDWKGFDEIPSMNTCSIPQDAINKRRKEIFSYSEGIKDSTDTYFHYSGFRDFYRWPLVYPFSINAVDSPDNGGSIYDESGIKDISNSSNEAEQMNIWDITEFTFNQKALLIESIEDTLKEYKILVFKSKEIILCSSKENMFEKSLDYGFSKSDSLITLGEYSCFF